VVVGIGDVQKAVPAFKNIHWIIKGALRAVNRHGIHHRHKPVFPVFISQQDYPVIARIADINAVIPDKKPLRVAEIADAQPRPQNIGAHVVRVRRGDLFLPEVVIVCVICRRSRQQRTGNREQRTENKEKN